ncbi:MAG: SH3 domain-containing protein [Acidobacteria bacterium]|nr:SH3 domain-containing protein [Acidobacteriota bacterium]
MNLGRKWNLKNYLRASLSRTLFMTGLLLVLSSSLGCSSKIVRVMTFQNDDTVQVQGSTVNIRQAASTSSRIISTVKRGDKLEVLDKTGSWYQIKTESGRTGWVHASLVK